MIKYTVKRKGWKSSVSFGTLKAAKEYVKNDPYCRMYGDPTKVHPDVFIIKEIHEKVWAGSKEEMNRPLPKAWVPKEAA